MSKKKIKVGLTKVELSKNAMILNADTCGSAGWWSNSNPDYNSAYIHYVEEWTNFKIIEDGRIKYNEIREKFGLQPGLDFDIPFKPYRGDVQVSFDTWVIDERDTGKDYEFVVDII